MKLGLKVDATNRIFNLPLYFIVRVWVGIVLDFYDLLLLNELKGQLGNIISASKLKLMERRIIECLVKTFHSRMFCYVICD